MRQFFGRAGFESAWYIDDEFTFHLQQDSVL